jgi:exo-beta-1,3-glucanase (GH17 family)
MTNYRKTIAMFAAISMLFVLPCDLLRKPVSASSGLSFISYLKSAKPEAALIAFSPTNHDPRAESRKVPSAESLRADLQKLRAAFDGLILYGYDRDTTHIILEEAQKQGYRAALLGIWDPKSEEEITGAVALVKQYHDKLALAVCIGNEGIFFKRYKLGDLQDAAIKFRKLLGDRTRVPITTSEPFKQYDQADVRRFGDFLAPNVHSVFDHPEWRPVDAAAWARKYALDLARSSSKPVLVKETGMPHGGKEQFTPEKQKEFWSAYIKEGRLVQLTRDVWVSYAAAFEAFDLPWKAQQSGLAIEDSWGLLGHDRSYHPAFFVWEGLRKRQSN